MFATYSVTETAKMTGIDRHKFPLLGKLGMLTGIKVGKKGVRYSEKDIEAFWERFKGADLSTEESIRTAAALERIKKARSIELLGGTTDRKHGGSEKPPTF